MKPPSMQRKKILTIKALQSDTKKLADFFTDFPISRGRRKYDPSALNVVASFDIETSSFYQKGDSCISVDEYDALSEKDKKGYEKRATLSAWGFGLNHKVLFGRTWNEFIELLKMIKEHYQLDPKKKILPVYIHNESYEFAWFCHRLNWMRVFAVSDRYPIRALCDLGIEFRDSLILSGMSLESTAKLCLKYPIKKLVGDWDYNLIRGYKTPITETEWGYLENDNRVVMCYLQELLDEYKNINRIPMTKTGFVREDVKNYCFWGKKKSHKRDEGHRFRDYMALMQSLTIDGSEEYNLMKWAFMGGFTHANSLNSNIIHENVTSYDISSSYPAVICSERFPMGKGQRVNFKTAQEFNETLKCYCVLMEIEFKGLESSFPYEHIISESKCRDLENAKVDNGRIISASSFRIALTDIDFECIKKFYRWKSLRVIKAYKYVRGYLPKAIVEKVIEYYEGKTTLKDVEGKEGEYARLKTLINSVFGMMVMDVVKNEISFDNEQGWYINVKSVDEEIEKYNNSKSRFLFYLWGVYITAYARRNIMSAILNCKEDHIYTDTDSEKIKHPEKHKKFFDSYNALIGRKIRKCLEYHGIDPSRAFPKTIEGNIKPLGVFEIDGIYKRFKTLGAKRYAVDYGKEKEEGKPWTRYSLTISGVNKKKATPAIYEKMQEEGKDFFDYFRFGQLFDKKMCGKLLHTYIDEPMKGILTDYKGKRMKYEELSCVHLENTTYEMTPSDDYFSLLNEISSIMYID